MKPMLLAAVLSFGLLDGCRAPSDSPEITAEIATQGAYAVMKSRKQRPAPTPSAECCGRCVNGKVKSGDGLAWVNCPCPAGCKCKCSTGACQPQVKR